MPSMTSGGEVMRLRTVRTIEAQSIDNNDAFRQLISNSDEPLLLKGAQFNQSPLCFTLENLNSEFGALKLPENLQSAKQGKSTPSGCSLSVADQGDESVMKASPSSWQPSGCTFSTLAKGITGSSLYLSTRSGNGACSRAGGTICYEGPAREGADPDESVLVRAFVPKVPFPLFLPSSVGFQIIFWMGSQGKNFGLHTDLFSEQFLVQNQGVKELFLLLPRDASQVAPFPYLSSPLWYKSQQRSVANLDRECLQEECLRAVLHPGDVLYIPLWWWHEVETVSPGPSVSTTFRFHTEDRDRFAKVMNAMYCLNANAKKQASSRLAQHLLSFFSHGLAAEAVSAGKCGSNVTRSERLQFAGHDLHLILLVGLAGTMGFVAGQFFR